MILLLISMTTLHLISMMSWPCLWSVWWYCLWSALWSSLWSVWQSCLWSVWQSCLCLVWWSCLWSARPTLWWGERPSWADPGRIAHRKGEDAVTMLSFILLKVRMENKILLDEYHSRQKWEFEYLSWSGVICQALPQDRWAMMISDDKDS